MSAKSVVATVVGFLSKHVGDLSAIHSAVAELVSIAPIDPQDKDRINSALETVQNSIQNITAFLEGNTVTEGTVTVKESDIVEALANFLASDAGKAALADAVKSPEGNADA